MSKMSLRMLGAIDGQDRTKSLPPREHCDFSCQERMCLFLDRVGVPRDQKWRTLILYMRSLEDYDVLDENQKAEIQALVLALIKAEEYTDQKFQEALTAQKKVLLKPFEKKVMAAVEETARTIQEFKATLQARKGDVENLAKVTLNTIQSNEDPEEAVEKIRQSFKEVVAYMEEDAAALDEKSRTDGLTGLANRPAFDDQLRAGAASCLKNGPPLSLVMLDIDHFKRINDTYGHRIGDQALVAVARLIKDFVAEVAEEVPGSLFAARFGGEEFALVAQGLAQTEAFHLAEIIRKKIAAYDFAIRDVDGRIVGNDAIRISAGVAEMKPAWGGNGAARLLEAADQALYKAKSQGRNRVCEAGSLL